MKRPAAAMSSSQSNNDGQSSDGALQPVVADSAVQQLIEDVPPSCDDDQRFDFVYAARMRRGNPRLSGLPKSGEPGRKSPARPQGGASEGETSNGGSASHVWQNLLSPTAEEFDDDDVDMQPVDEVAAAAGEKGAS